MLTISKYSYMFKCLASHGKIGQSIYSVLLIMVAILCLVISGRMGIYIYIYAIYIYMLTVSRDFSNKKNLIF